MNQRKHAHYFRNVSHLSEIDVYRVLDVFDVTDQALGHAIKKLLAPGGRGAGKDFRRDVQEAIDTLTRRLEMLDEDALRDETEHAATAPVVIPPAPDYLPDTVAIPAQCPDPHGAANNTADDGWIEWGGGECPVPEGAKVQVKYRDNSKFTGFALQDMCLLDTNWIVGYEDNPAPHHADIIAYRVIKAESTA